MKPLPTLHPPYSPQEWSTLTRAAHSRAHVLRDEALQAAMDAGLRPLRRLLAALRQPSARPQGQAPRVSLPCPPVPAREA